MNKEFIENLRKAWSLETCYPRARRFWKPELPELGHCSVSAALINLLYGGRIVMNEENYHFWNVLPDGKEVDLTIKQFEEVPEGTFMTIDKDVTLQEMLQDQDDLADRLKLLRDKVSAISSK